MFISSYINKNHQNCCVVFITQQSNLDIETQIINYLSENISPSNVYILYNSEYTSVNKDDFNRFNNSAIRHFINFDAKGNFSFENSINIKSENKVIEQIKKEVLKQIFLRHDCILKASSESYFVMPSGKLATHFVRIANLFKDSSEISIVSILLLPYVKDEIDYVYCDTPTIFSLIYSCILYKLKFNKDYKVPEVKFYSSSKLSDNDFDRTKSSLYIVSTSINGSLPKKIVNYGIDWKNIVVLFSFDNDKSPFYCSLFKDDRCELIDRSFYSMEKVDFQKQYPNKIFPIKFEDEQFIPTQPNVSKILLKKDDAPEFINLFYDRYKNYDLIKCFSHTNSLGYNRDIFFDINNLLHDENHFSNKLQKQVINKLPYENLVIIYVDNDNSKILSEYIINESKRVVISKSIKELENDTTLNINERYNFYVISSCISNGKKVSKCSMLLRQFKNSNINFISGFVRCNDKIVLKNIKSNLTYGEYGFDTFNFYSLEEIYLPNEDSTSLSWESEKKMLNDILNDDFKQLNIKVTLPLKKYLSKRRESLQDEYLINNLYLPSIKFISFKLNKNFAFFNNRDWEPKDIKQSQVYFTILSVLHNYKLTKMVKQTLYERHILDPENFIRFNDSIIRATFLRCCSKEELNYNLDFKLSEKILNIIAGLINDLSKGDHIIYEFLLAICLNRLQINQIHLKELYDRLINTNEYKSDYVIKFYLDYIHITQKL